MNKNKFSQFLLSASAGVVITFSISEIQARGNLATSNQLTADLVAENTAHKTEVAGHIAAANPGMAPSKVDELTNKIVQSVHGLVAVKLHPEKAAATLAQHILAGNDLTAGLINAFAREIGNADTLAALGLDSVRQLKSASAERRVVPSQVTNFSDAEYFAQQRKASGEFKTAAEFYVAARGFAMPQDPTVLRNLGEEAMLMYNEHFIHHVARVSSITAENVKAATDLLNGAVTTLANTLDSDAGYRRAANCAKELGTGIHDLILAQKKEKDALDPVNDAAKIASMKTAIAKLYIDLYKADVLARDMYQKAGAKLTGLAKQKEIASAADAMRLAVGALADAVAESDTVKFSDDPASVTVKQKLLEEASNFVDGTLFPAFNQFDTWEVFATEEDKMTSFARRSEVLKAQLKSLYNAWSKLSAGSADRTTVKGQYDTVKTAFDSMISTAGSGVDAIHAIASAAQKARYAADLGIIREVKAEFLYRDVLFADVAGIDAAVVLLRDYVKDNGSVAVVSNVDTAIKDERSATELQKHRNVKADVNRSLGLERALVAKAYAHQLTKDDAATTANRATRLEAFLEYARMASNADAWNAGVSAADVLLAIAGISTPAAIGAGTLAQSELVNVLAKAAKAEGLLFRNVTADDTLVATVDAAGALDAGLLFEADATATGILVGSIELRVRARKALRKSFERAVELHNNATVKQGLRTVWYGLEDAYATDEAAVADAALGAAYINGNSTFMAEILATLNRQATLSDMKFALGAQTVAATVTAGGGGTVINNANYIHITIGGTRYVTKALADVAVVTDFEFEAAAGAPAGGATAFTITLDAAPLDLDALAAELGKNVAGVAQAGTLAAHYAALVATPAVAVDGVSLDSLDTVEKLYNHLVSKFETIRSGAAEDTRYGAYARARDAWAVAANVAGEWAKIKADALVSTGNTNFATERDAIGLAYTTAADYETKRLRAMFAANGRGKYGDAAFDALDEIVNVMAANTGRLASTYVTEDVLDVLRVRSERLKASAEMYNKTGTTAAGVAVAASDANRNRAVLSATSDTIVTAGTGAYEVFAKLVRAGFQGAANFNAAAAVGDFAKARFKALEHAYRKVNGRWLTPLLQAIDFGTNAVGADATPGRIRDEIHNLLTDGVAIVNSANAATQLADAIFDMGDQIAGGAGNYVDSQSLRRDLALAYETVMRTITALGAGTVAIPLTSVAPADSVDTRLVNVQAAAAAQSLAAANVAVTAALPTTDPILDQVNASLTVLTELADAAAAAGAGAYAATKADTASVDANKPLREVRINEEVNRIRLQRARDAYELIANGTDVAITADLRAKAAHQFARVLEGAGKAYAQRFANINATEHKTSARNFYVESVGVYEAEIASLQSVASANTRLIEAHQNLEEVLQYAIDFGADSVAYGKKQVESKLQRARLLYREGQTDRSSKLLDELLNVSGNAIMHQVLDELASQYEAAGKFSKAALAYANASQQSTGLNKAEDAFTLAKRGYAAASQTGYAEAYVAVADAFTKIGDATTFHAHVRAEAYAEAARSLIDAEKFEAAAVQYEKSAAQWSRVGDHMQSGNHYEKAAWALSKVTGITTTQRVTAMEYLAKGTHQLQLAEATHRLIKLADLSEVHLKALEAAGSATVTDFRKGIVAMAETLYEKALAFQRDQDTAHAVAAEARITVLLGQIDGGIEEAKINQHLAKLYELQGKNANAVNMYIAAAEGFNTAGDLLTAAKAYNMAAGAASKAGQGSRVQSDIIDPMTALSEAVRDSAHAAKGSALQHDIHIEVLEALYAYAAVYPGQGIESAKAELAVVKGESAGRTATQSARVYAIELGLLRAEAKTLGGNTTVTAASLLAAADAALANLKGIVGGTNAAKLEIEGYVARGASELADMYTEQNILADVDDATLAVNMKRVKDVLQSVYDGAMNATTQAKTIHGNYSKALAALDKAAFAYAEVLRNFAAVFSSDPARIAAEDTAYMLDLTNKLVAVGAEATRVTLLGVVTEREEAQAMKAAYSRVMSSLFNVNVTTKAIRGVSDAYKAGKAAEAAQAKATMENTKANVEGESKTAETSVKAAQVTEHPVARVEAVKVAVDTHVDAVIAHVKAGLEASATIATKAPVVSAEVKAANETLIGNHAEGVLTAVDNAAKKLATLQTAPTSAAQAVVNKR